MNKLKHTPGPWEAGHTNTIWRKNYYDSKGRRCHQPVCDSDIPAALPIEEKFANSRLIAAAPEMLEALMFGCKFLGQWLSAALDDPTCCDEFKDIIRDWMNKNHSAIEKATDLKIEEILED